MGLRFGGNDVGSVMLEENVVRAAGVTNCTTEEELRRIIRDAGSGRCSATRCIAPTSSN